MLKVAEKKLTKKELSKWIKENVLNWKADEMQKLARLLGLD